jgi:hypothetical protein
MVSVHQISIDGSGSVIREEMLPDVAASEPLWSSQDYSEEDERADCQIISILMSGKEI